MAEGKNERPSFEVALKQLEDIVKKLEGGEDSLEKSMKLFEEGIKLARYLDDKLDEAEKKLELLMKKRDEIVSREVDEEEFFNRGRSGGEDAD